MNGRGCACVFPSPSEEELITLPGSEDGTALRVLVEPGPEGYVRLQQLVHNAGLGWYVQKSFVIPGEALAALVPQLRKADCLIPRRSRKLPPAAHADAPPMRLIPAPPADEDPDEPVRRRA